MDPCAQPCVHCTNLQSLDFDYYKAGRPLMPSCIDLLGRCPALVSDMSMAFDACARRQAAFSLIDLGSCCGFFSLQAF